MKRIELQIYGTGHYAIVDDEDLDWLMTWKWRCDSHGYASREEFYKHDDGSTRRRRIAMHRVINQTPQSMDTDHIDGNPLDNRRANLRSCSHMENMWNQGPEQGSSSPYLGVCWDNYYQSWVTSITTHGVTNRLGYFDAPEHAALIYNHYAVLQRGKFARLNVIDELVMSLPKQRDFVVSWVHNRGYRKSQTGWRGVELKPSGKWAVTVAKNGHRYRLGLFTDPLAAAQAYNHKASELFGERARLNRVDL